MNTVSNSDINTKEYQELAEKRMTSEDIFDGVVLHVKKDTVKLPNGESATRELIRHIGAVCVIPVDDKMNVVMERQFRYPIDTVISEIPAGKLDAKDEDRFEAIKRELREETGYTADEWVNLGLFYPAPAYSDEAITLWLARGLHEGTRELDEDEFLNVELVPLSQLLDDVMSGRITDGKTQIMILKAAKYLGL